MPAFIEDLPQVADRLWRSTVHVEDAGRGGGLIWRAGGLVVTNAHKVRRTDARVKFSNGH